MRKEAVQKDGKCWIMVSDHMAMEFYSFYNVDVVFCLLSFQFHLLQRYKKAIFVSIGEAHRTVRCASPKLGKEMEIETIRETKMVWETEILREMYIKIWWETEIAEGRWVFREKAMFPKIIVCRYFFVNGRCRRDLLR
jgi:hypothetical protein